MIQSIQRKTEASVPKTYLFRGKVNEIVNSFYASISNIMDSIGSSKGKLISGWEKPP